MLRPKRVQDSRTEQIQILMPEHINGAGRLFGGKLVEWIDVVAGVVARRHSGRNVITAAIDNLQFKEGAYVNNTLVLVGRSPMWAAPPWTYGWIPMWRGWTGCARRSIGLIWCWWRWTSRNSRWRFPAFCWRTKRSGAEWEAGERRRELRSRRRKEGY